MEPLIPEGPLALTAILAVAGVVLAGILTAAYSALERLSRSHVAELAQSSRPRAPQVTAILERRDVCLLGVYLARQLAEAVFLVALTAVTVQLLPTWWSVLATAVLAGWLILAFVNGGMLRELGRRKPAATVHGLALLIRVLGWLAYPLAVASVRRTAEPARQAEHREQGAEDLRGMVDLASEKAHIEDQERELLQSVFELGRTFTREVMVPRPDMITVNAGTTLDKALTLFIRSGFSRAPVIGENVDDVRGILFLKDCLRASRRPSGNETLVEDVMRPARLVPEMKLVDDLMREMQAESTHIAIVIDEYGGVAGLVTMEDLIEELVGEVQDEHDANLPAVQEVTDGVFRIPARLPVDELGDLFELDLDDDDVDTAGGLLAKALGRVPIEGASADAYGLHLVAERAGGRRRQVVTLLASRTVPPEEEE